MKRDKYCPCCKYDLTGLPEYWYSVCPECGYPATAKDHAKHHQIVREFEERRYWRWAIGASVFTISYFLIFTALCAYSAFQ